MKFRKKPVVIDAWNYEGDYVFDTWKDLPDWIREAYEKGILIPIGGKEGITIKTLEGDHRADIGDWVIKGVKGELYPCKPDIFKQTYEIEPKSDYLFFSKEESLKNLEGIKDSLEKRYFKIIGVPIDQDANKGAIDKYVDNELNKTIADRFALLHKRYLDRCGHIEIWDAQYLNKECSVFELLERMETELKNCSGTPSIHHDWRMRVLGSRVKKEVLKITEIEK